MSARFRPFASIVSAAFAVVVAPAISHADVSFSDFSGFTINQTDTDAAPSISGSTIHLATGGEAEARSIVTNTAQNISQFTASFTYQDVREQDFFYGATFMLENNSAGAHAVGGANDVYGYGGLTGKSAAISLETHNIGSFSGFYTNGAATSGGIAISPVNLPSGDLINVMITYDGSILHEHLVDASIPADTYDASYLVNLPNVLGSSTAFVGLTVSTGLSGSFSDNQYFSNFNFTSGAVPEPASLSLLGVATLPLLLRRRPAIDMKRPTSI